ncbi:MAG: PDZ domain-containing protein, partial [Flavobacteriaceae bacterium]|nr:PDZ domain-containing protein [Flavobacteriaceae bacterium]
DGSLAELPFPRGGFCSFSPDDQKLAFNRIFREFRTWKRYRGGMADDIWIFDFKTKKTINITNNPAQDIIPMWHGDKIYYLSDRGEFKRMNLYVYDLQSKQTKKITAYKDFDIKFPSLGDKDIVYENAGYIYKIDLGTDISQKVNITIMEDFVSGRSEYKDVSKSISNYEIAPDGKRALFGAHGDVFTVPEKYGEIRNLTQSSGIHERNSKWSPDGKWITFISDKTGEDEIYKQTQNGSNAAIQLTSKGKAYKYQPYWSPDSKKILWSDSEHKLKYIDVNTKKVVDVDFDPNRAIRHYDWSPDNKWITYTKTGDNRFALVFIYSLDQKKSYPVTSDWYNSGQSIFSDDGKYLFFISNREYNSGFSQVEFDISYNDMGNIYFVTLAKETKSLFEPKSDEVALNKKEEKSDNKEKKKDKKSTKTPTVTKIDIIGIQDRIGKLPLSASRYLNLASVKNKLYFTRSGIKDKKPIFYMYDLDKRKETKLGLVGGYEISSDKKKMLVSQNGSYAIIDLPKSEIKIKDKLDLSDMQIYMNKKEEWQQIYNESWRQYREFFFAPNMHGVDWVAMKKNYAPLVKHVNHRNDLTYVIGELVSELNVGHAYVSGGDRPMPERIKMGLLGAEIEKDKSGYFKITKILKGQNWDKSLKSPLSDIGVNANVGDYILAINGQSTKEMDIMYKALVNTAGKQVKLVLNSKPTELGKREVTVVPVSDESKLYYLKWVSENIEKVNIATNGKV